MFVQKTDKIKLVVYVTVVLILTFLISFGFNKERYVWWANFKPLDSYPVSASWKFHEPTDYNLKLNKVVFYREDLARSGFVNQSLDYDLDFDKSWSFKGLTNNAIHGASSPQPVLTNDGILLTTTDTGVLQAQTKDKSLWSFRSLSAAFGIHSSTSLIGQTIYVGDYKGNFYSIESKTGRLNWMSPIGETVGASPAYYNGFLYIAVETREPNGFVVKLNAKNGEVVWTSKYLGEQSHSSPAVDVEKGIMVLGDNLGYISGLSEETGEFLWRYQTGGPVKSAPVLVDGVSYVSSWDGHVYAHDISTGEMLWRLKISDYTNQSSLAIFKNNPVLGFIVSADKGLCSINLKKGKIEKCLNKAFGRGARIASPTITLSKDKKFKFLVWVPCFEKKFCVYEPESLNLLKSWSLGSAVSGSPNIFDKSIYFFTEKKPGLVVLK